MAGQEIPEEGGEMEEFSEEEDDDDADDLKQKSKCQSIRKKIPTLMARLLPLRSNSLLHSPFLLLKYKHLPCQDHHLWTTTNSRLGLLDHLQAFLLGQLQGLLHS